MKSVTDQLLENISVANINDFFRRKIGAFKLDPDDLEYLIPDNGYENFIQLQKHGEVSYDDGDELLVFSCKYEGELTARSAKKKQYDIAKKVLKDDFKDGAIFIFYDADGRFRFSFIRRNYGDDEAKYTPWRRYTYYVNAVDSQKYNKTFKRRIDLCKFESLDEIQEAFSVEPLSKQFYKDLSYWYFAALNEVKFPNEKNENDYVVQANAMIRLITRLMFVWFMKQKGLVPDQLFDKAYLDGLLKYEDKTGSTYYKAILQNLFFATLNTPMGKERKFVSSQYGIQNFYRYERFINDKEAFIKLIGEVPFLNGGLFENLDRIITADPEKKQEKVEIRVDCFSDNKKNEQKLTVPDHLFFGEWEADISEFFEDSKKTNISITGIIDILNQYDFTIDENTPTDQEVALDPELLGLVFENLLASYNPETQSTARKESGSFYTPRPIVEYMVVESLSHYLHNVTNYPVADLKKLFLDNGKQPFTKQDDKVKVIDAISELKIIDPACGSGAFPMGTLQKMVLALAKLDPENTLWRESQERRIKKQLTENLDTKSLEDIKRDLDRAFDNELNDPDYARKLYLIENCLYGVDIQPIAMQISKLRFFISLLVEQRIDRAEENLGIIALPNLETKFVAANTLIKLKKPVSGKKGQANTLFLKNINLEKLEDKLEDSRHRYFTAKTPKTKRKYRSGIKEIRQQMSDILEGDGWDSSEAKKISQWDPFDPNGKSKWFDQKWMYGLDHFDVVIGNPPYIQLQKALPGHEDMKYADVYKEQQYRTFERTGDIYALFYERGMDMLHSQGVLSYITSNSWMRSKHGISLRRFLSKLNPIQIIDLGPGVFDAATVDVNILLMENMPTTSHHLESLTLVDREQITNLENSDFTVMENLSEENWIILAPDELALKKKIELLGMQLKDWHIDINYGIKTGYNKAFIIDGNIKDELIKVDNNSAEIIKPILRGRDISRYKAKFADKWLVCVHNGYKVPTGSKVDAINIEKYPAVKSWLDSDADKVIKRKDQGKTPYHLRNCAYLEDFSNPKIVWGEISDKSKFCFDDTGQYMEATGFIMTGSKLKYLSALLNSKLSEWMFQLIGTTTGMGTNRWKKYTIEKLPVLVPDSKLEKKIDKLVDKISVAEGDEFDQLQNEIDLVVYKLYELTYEEVLIVDPGTDIGRKEYEGYNL